MFDVLGDTGKYRVIHLRAVVSDASMERHPVAVPHRVHIGFGQERGMAF